MQVDIWLEYIWTADGQLDMDLVHRQIRAASLRSIRKLLSYDQASCQFSAMVERRQSRRGHAICQWTAGGYSDPWTATASGT